ncbi:MAG TPA: DinB family protein [Thermoanaerobaculia bacterium]|nr:DinB family protein [Thermoanaerobaculia bacterium]
MRLSSIASILIVSAIPLAAAVRTPPAHELRQTASPATPKSGVRAELLHDLDDMQKKILSLASAMPAEKYAWRPVRGVRSVSEVYMHIAGGNYTLVSFVGDKPMLDTRSYERVTEKFRVVEELRRSFDYLRNAIINTSDADLDKPIRMFGNDSTERAAFMMALNHLHEHLGQSVAYARMNGVVPPWSTE